MHVLVIGSGGRSAAIRWACRRHGHDVDRAEDFDPTEHGTVDLVIVGPEAALAGGVADRCAAAGVPCFSGSCSEVYLEKAFDDTGWRPTHRLPNAKELGETSLMFLVHPNLTSAEISKTCDVLKATLATAAL